MPIAGGYDPMNEHTGPDLVAQASAASDAIAYAWNLDSNEITWGPRVELILGPLPSSGRFPALDALIFTEDLEGFEKHVAQARQDGTKVWASLRLKRTDGTLRWTVLRGGFISNGGPPNSLLTGIIVDVNEQKLAELAAARRLHEYRQVLDSLPDRVWSKDLAGRFTTVNRAYIEFADHGSESILGKTIGAVHPLQMIPKSASEDYEVTQFGRSIRGENVMISRGREYHFEILKSPLRDEDGRIIGITGMTHDVTERHSLQESLANANRELQSILDTCPTGICIVRHRIIERCNPAAAAMLGYTPEELIGKSPRILYPDQDSWERRSQEIYPNDRQQRVTQLEVEFQRKNGSRVWVLVTSNIINSSEEYGVGSWIDITAQRNLSNAMIEARDAAHAANKAKSNFLATMSHEIRTPMHGILGMLELLESSKLDDAQRETAHMARDSAHSLMGLIDGILDFSKIEADKIEITPAPFDLRKLVRQCVLLYREGASKQGLQLVDEVDSNLSQWLLGDGYRIRQIIYNLLANAMKFTPSGKISLYVRTDAAPNKSQHLGVSVTDTGIGIDANVQSKLFQPFVQADSGTTRRFGGTGLGLAISKRLAESMGGSLELTSAPGQGTTVTLSLTLPVSPAPGIPDSRGKETPVPEKPPADIARARLLVAEDHPVNLRMLARQLEQLGYKADLARDGVEALRMWRGGDYALLISDCHMPEMDGYDLAREIRSAEAAAPARKPMPIIACTASALAEEGVQCIEAGMNGVMVKPVSLETLRKHLEKWLPKDDGGTA